jgi:glycosyltransferase involved in cell wall biosynthesis
VTLASVAAAGAPPTERRIDGYTEVVSRWDLPRTPLIGKLRLSRDLDAELASIMPAVDVIHGHGLWLWPNVAAPRAARRASRPFILAPRGMLAREALAFSRRQKLAFWTLLQGPALDGVGCIHVTSLQERDEVRAFGLMAPIALAPNGIDLPTLEGPRPMAPDGRREVLYLGRLHPKKSVEMLIEAWARIRPERRAGWRLRIVGPSEDDYDRELAVLATRLGLIEELAIEPPIYGPAKLDAYRRAEVFVLPTRNENFGLTVAEALAAATPAISTRGAPWGGLETERCGWWPAYGVEAMVAVLEAALSTPAAELRAMGERGRAWMARDYSWAATANCLLEVAAWLRDGSLDTPPPAILPD